MDSIRRRLLPFREWVHQDDRAIASGLVFASIFVFAGKLISAGKEVIVAARYGTGADLDAFMLLSNLCLWPIGIAFSVYTVVLVPIVQRAKNKENDLDRFHSELLGSTIVLGLVLGVGAYFGASWWLDSRHCSFAAPAVAAGHQMLLSLAALIPLAMGISLFSAWMIASGRHLVTLLEALPALVIAVALLVFPWAEIHLLAISTLAGYFCHLVWLTVIARKTSSRLLPRFTFRSPTWKAFSSGCMVVVMGQMFIGTIPVVDQFFAVELKEGSVAALSYATRLWSLIMGLGGTAVTRATLHVFASANSTSGRTTGARLVRNWSLILFLCGAVMAGVAWQLSDFVVRMLFERGSFTAIETEAVAGVFRWGLLQIPFYFAGLVWVSAITSQQRYSVLLWTGVAGLLVKVLANYFLIGILEVGGIALSWVFVYAANCMLLAWSYKREIRVQKETGDG